MRFLFVVLIVLLPMVIQASEAEDRALAGKVSASDGPEVAFGELQLFKARVLHERRWGPDRSSKEAVSDSLITVSLKDLQDHTLRDGEIFLDTYAGQGQSLVFAVTKDQCRMLELPGEEEMKPLLMQLHQLASLVKSDQDELADAAAQVSELLLGPLSDELEKCRNLIFSPDGVFNLTPTSLLLPEKQSMKLMRVPSAATLMDLRHWSAGMQPLNKPRILAVGGVLDPAASGLPGSDQELQDLDETYAGVTVVRPNGGGAAPELDKLLGFDVIHVSALTIGDDRNPWLSAIALDPSNPGMMIRALDLNGIKLDTSLVVLSNCSSAAGGHLSGEGVQGLTTAFLASGVSAVVASLWPVDEHATGFFMAAFYEGLYLGKNAAASLVYAREQCRQDAVFNLPFHWGAFVLVGEGQVQLPLATKTTFGVVGRWLVLLAGVAAGLVFMFRIRRGYRTS
jgi:CHAT domain-containing protein